MTTTPVDSENLEFHFGVVAYIDGDGIWQFDCVPVGGDESPFPEMDWGTVYNQDSGEWEKANQYHWSSTDREKALGETLDQGVRAANYLLKGGPTE